MRKVKLKDIAEISTGNSAPSKQDFSKEGIPFVRAGNLEFLTRGISIDMCEKVSNKLAEIKKLKLVPKGAVLFAKSGMSAKMGRVYELPKDAYVVSHLAIISAKNSSVNSSFIKYFFTYRPPFNLIRDDGYPSISISDIKQVDINLPDIQTQNKIVDVLDRANSLVKKRKETIELLDELLRATFLDMFGDPVINKKNWKVISMNQAVIKITSGVSYGGDEKKALSEDELGVLKISSVTSGVFNPNEFKAVDKKYIKKTIIPVMKGQFLISRANTRELVAACCIVPKDYPNLFIPDKLWRLTIDENRITKDFLNHLLKSENYRNTVRRKASGGHSSMLNISQKKFMNLPLVQPPVEIQLRFDKSVEKIEGIKRKFTISLQNIENVFNSITQKVFNGELNFNIDFELDSLVREINLEKKQNDLSKIGGDIAYLQRLVDKLNAQEFEEKEMYDKAKHAVYQLLKEHEKITQEYNEQSNNVKLVLK